MHVLQLAFDGGSTKVNFLLQKEGYIGTFSRCRNNFWYLLQRPATVIRSNILHSAWQRLDNQHWADTGLKRIWSVFGYFLFTNWLSKLTMDNYYLTCTKCHQNTIANSYLGNVNNADAFVISVHQQILALVLINSVRTTNRRTHTRPIGYNFNLK